MKKKEKKSYSPPPVFVILGQTLDPRGWDSASVIQHYMHSLMLHKKVEKNHFIPDCSVEQKKGVGREHLPVSCHIDSLAMKLPRSKGSKNKRGNESKGFYETSW